VGWTESGGFRTRFVFAGIGLSRWALIVRDSGSGDFKTSILVLAAGFTRRCSGFLQVRYFALFSTRN